MLYVLTPSGILDHQSCRALPKMFSHSSKAVVEDAKPLSLIPESVSNQVYQPEINAHTDAVK